MLGLRTAKQIGEITSRFQLLKIFNMLIMIIRTLLFWFLSVTTVDSIQNLKHVQQGVEKLALHRVSNVVFVFRVFVVKDAQGNNNMKQIDYNGS